MTEGEGEAGQDLLHFVLTIVNNISYEQYMYNTNDDSNDSAPMPMSQSDTRCGSYELYDTTRFIFTFLSSFVVATGGMLSNLLLVYVFATKPQPDTPSLCPLTLAVLDFLLCLVYMLIFGFDSMGVFLRLKPIFTIWITYIHPVFCISRTIQLMIPYVLMYATFERLMWIASSRNGLVSRCSGLKQLLHARGRRVTIMVIVLICFTMRMPFFWAFKITYFPNCTDYFRSKELSPTSFFFTPAYAIYDVWVLTFFTVILPFFILLALNLTIITKLSNIHRRRKLSRPANESTELMCDQQNGKHQQELLFENGVQYSSMKERSNGEPSVKAFTSSCPLTANGSIRRQSNPRGSFSLNLKMAQNSALVALSSIISGAKLENTAANRKLRERRKLIRNAIFTMLVIGCSYLICNGLHIVLMTMERMQLDILVDPDDEMRSSAFYVIFSDVVSFLYMFTSAIRLAIYAKCNPNIRRHIIELTTCRLYCWNRTKKTISDASSPTNL